MYRMYRMSQVKILEKNADQITFQIGQKKGYFSMVLIIILFILTLGSSISVLMSLISDILDGNSSSLFIMLLFVVFCAYIFFITFCQFYCSLCTFNFKTHQIELFQESRIRKQQITESINNFLRLKITESSSYDRGTELSVYLELVSNKNIYLGIIGGEPEDDDRRMLYEIKHWIETNK
jgi:hypothetical protein